MISTKTKLERALFKGVEVVSDSGLLPAHKLSDSGLEVPVLSEVSPVLVVDGKFPILAHTWNTPRRSPWLDILESHGGLVVGTDASNSLMLAGTSTYFNAIVDFVKKCQGRSVVIGKRADDWFVAAPIEAFVNLCR